MTLPVNPDQTTTDITMTGDQILSYAIQQGIAADWQQLKQLVETIDHLRIFTETKKCRDEFDQAWATPDAHYYTTYPFCCYFDSIYEFVDARGFNLPLTGKFHMNAGPVMLIYMMAKAHRNGWRMPRYSNSSPEPFYHPYPLPEQFPKR